MPYYEFAAFLFFVILLYSFSLHREHFDRGEFCSIRPQKTNIVIINYCPVQFSQFQPSITY